MAFINKNKLCNQYELHQHYVTYPTFWKEQPTLLQRIRLNIGKANYIILLKQLHPKIFYCVEFMTFLIVNAYTSNKKFDVR